MKKFYPFFTLVLLVQVARGQAPGGVSSNLQLWIKANTGTTTAGSQLTSWNYANNGNSFSATGTGPVLNTSIINFQPAVTFSGQLMDGPAGASAPIAANKPDYSMFTVWRSNSLTSFQRVWTQAGNTGAADGFSLATWNDARHIYGNEIETSPYDYSLTAHFNTDVWNITQINILNQATNDQEIVTDSNYQTGPIVSSTDFFVTNGPASRNLGTFYNELGSKGAAGNQSLSGDIAEVIVFDRPINLGGEREKVFSYLSLKYGIPLNANLVSSGGTVIWDATANAGYNNAVFGLAQDNASVLSVTQSNSIVTGSGDGTGQSGKGNIVLSNPSSLADQGFLLIGNDNGGFAQVTSTKAGAQQFTQKWKVQQTGTVGTVDLDFDFTGLTTAGTIGDATKFQIQLDTDGDGDFTTGTQTYINPGAFNGNSAHFAALSLSNGTVFTMISSPTALPVTWRSFTASLVANNNISLNWQIDNNQDGKVYQVEHSLDGISFTQVGEVSNNPNVKSYSFLYTPVTSGTHYFRVREADFDAQYIYSKIVSINTLTSDLPIRVINNPTSENFTQVEITAAATTSIHIELWSAGGSRISELQQTVGAGLNRITVPLDQVAPGNYLLKIRAGAVTQTEKIIKL